MKIILEIIKTRVSIVAIITLLAILAIVVKVAIYLNNIIRKSNKIK